MKRLIMFLLGVSLVSQISSAVWAQPRLEFLRAGEVKPLGWIQRQMRLDLAEGLTGNYHKVSNAVNLRVFEKQNRPAGGFVEIPIDGRQKSWWSGEHEGYWKDSVIHMGFLLNNDVQMRRAHEWMRQIIASQDEDGYIGIYDRETRFPKGGENGELWVQSRIFQAMLAYYEFTGDEKVLDAVQKATQLSLSKYHQTTYFGVEGGQGGLSHGIGFMDTLEWLYRITGEAVYRAGMIWLYQDYQKLSSRGREMQLERLLDLDQKWQEHTPHIMEGLHMPAIVFALTGDEIYGRAAANALVKFDHHMNPGGGVVGDESVLGRAGSADMPSEYCTMTESVSSLNRIVAWSGVLSTANRTERICLNAAQGARFHPANRAVRYLTMDNQRTANDHIHNQRLLYSAWHQAAACCTLNSGRLMPYYVEGMWYRDTSKDALIAALYGPCRINTSVAGVNVALVEQTHYPFSDRVEMIISPEKPVRFMLVFRLPPGAQEAQIDAGAGSEITRFEDRIEVVNTWKADNRIVIDFDFNVRRRQDRNSECFLQWGPLVFALPLPEERKEIRQFAALDGQDSGFRMWEIRPTNEQAWKYRFDGNAPFEVTSLLGGDYDTPWANPPIGLKGTMRTAENMTVEVTFKPLGSTLLRRTSFPVHTTE